MLRRFVVAVLGATSGVAVLSVASPLATANSSATADSTPAAPTTEARRSSAGCASPVAEAHPASGFPIAVGSTNGRYLLHEPAGSDRVPAPLMLDLHGYSETAEIQELFSGLATAAASSGAIGATPQIERTVPHWITGPGSTDIAFVGAVIDDIARRTCVDLDRVYAAGLSNGAMFTSRLACELGDRLAAVAAVAGVQHPEQCTPSRLVPILAIHGTHDDYLPYDGGLGPAVARLPTEDGTSTMGTITVALPASITDPVTRRMEQWAEQLACSTHIERPLAMEVELTDYECPAGRDVQLVTVFGGGHTWPGSTFASQIAGQVGATTMAVSANQLILDFFARFSLPPA